MFSSDRRGIRFCGGSPWDIPNECRRRRNVTDPVFARATRSSSAIGQARRNLQILSNQPLVHPIRSSPQYSPDGEAASPSALNCSGSNEIWVSDSSGRIPVQLTHYAGPLTGTPPPDVEYSVRHPARKEAEDSTVGAPHEIRIRRCRAFLVQRMAPGFYFASNRTGRSAAAWRSR